MRESWGMGEYRLTKRYLDVYLTRKGPWNPDHGEIEIPADWEFFPSGDAFVTRRLKAAGRFWVAWRPRGRNRAHRRRLGLWAPKEAIEAAEAEAAATEEQRSKRREPSARSRAKQEAAYRDELEDAIRRFLAFAPEHVDLGDEIARGGGDRGGGGGKWAGWAHPDALLGATRVAGGAGGDPALAHRLRGRPLRRVDG